MSGPLVTGETTIAGLADLLVRADRHRLFINHRFGWWTVELREVPFMSAEAATLDGALSALLSHLPEVNHGR